VHGGMGFIEETGAAQPYRDVRITTIYEGTTAIQANDFIGRKIARDGGAALTALLTDIGGELVALDASGTPHAAVVAAARDAAREAVAALAGAGRSVLVSWAQGPEHAFAVSVPLLRMTGHVLGGWLLAKSAAIAARRLAAGDTDTDFLRGKIASAQFYAAHVLPQVHALGRVVERGAASVVDIDAAVI